MQVVIRNPQYAQADRYCFAVPEFFSYSGSPAQLKHVSADSLALTTGQADWPVRVIPRAWIVSIDGAAYAHTAGPTLTRTVQGSRGEQYVVTLGAQPHCTCAGFAFRRSCKHTLSDSIK